MECLNNKSHYWLLPIRSIAFLSIFPLLAWVTGNSLTYVSRWWPVLAVIVNIACVLLLHTLTKGNYKCYINYKKGKTRKGFVISVIAFSIILGVGGMYGAGFIVFGAFPYLDTTMIQPIPIFAAVLCVILLPLSTTLAEDGIHLGIINSTDGSKSVTLVSAFFFAVQHSFIPFLMDSRFMLFRFLSFLPLALLYCFWYQKSRNPLPFMIGHFVMNLFTVAMLMAVAIYPDLFM